MGHVEFRFRFTVTGDAAASSDASAVWNYADPLSTDGLGRASPSHSVTFVPEPASAAPMLAALLALVARRARRP
jgi:hypothetical protein